MRDKPGLSKSRVYTVLLGSLVLIVAALTGGIIWFNSTKTEELAIVSADRLIAEIGDKILERVQLLYDPMIAVVALAARVPELRAMCDADDPPATPFFIRGLKAYPQIFSLYAGFADGGFFMVSHIEGEQRAAARTALGAPDGAAFAVEHIRVGGDGARRVSWLFLDADQQRLAEREDPASTFDPRQRDWFKLARDGAGMVQRTAPYQFASSKEAGVTLSNAIEGAVPGAFGADLAIGELSHFLAAQAIGTMSRIFVFDGNGTIIASGAEKPAVPGTRIADLGDPVVAGLYDAFAKARESASLSLTLDGRAYVAQVRALPARYGKDEYLAIVVPNDEILKPIAAIRLETLFYSCAFLVFALPLYATVVVAWIDRRLGRRDEDTMPWPTEDES